MNVFLRGALLWLVALWIPPGSGDLPRPPASPAVVQAAQLDATPVAREDSSDRHGSSRADLTGGFTGTVPARWAPPAALWCEAAQRCGGLWSVADRPYDPESARGPPVTA